MKKNGKEKDGLELTDDNFPILCTYRSGELGKIDVAVRTVGRDS